MPPDPPAAILAKMSSKSKGACSADGRSKATASDNISRPVSSSKGTRSGRAPRTAETGPAGSRRRKRKAGSSSSESDAKDTDEEESEEEDWSSDDESEEPTESEEEAEDDGDEDLPSSKVQGKIKARIRRQASFTILVRD